MMGDLITKYLDNKCETLFSYARSLIKLYEINDEKLWKNEDELYTAVNGILELYMINFYLTSELSIEEITEKNLSIEEYKMATSLALISKYYGKKYKTIKEEYKNSIYNLTLMIYIIINIDKEISLYGKSNITTKMIVLELIKLFGDAFETLKIDQNPFLVEVLANKIRDAERKEIRFFESLDTFDCYNVFSKCYDNEYLVDYKMDIEELRNYNNLNVEHVMNNNSYKDDYKIISIDYLALTILKCYANKCIVPNFIVKIDYSVLINAKYFKSLTSALENKRIKEKVFFALSYKDYKKNYSKLKNLKIEGFNFIVILDNSIKVKDFSNLKGDTIYYFDKNLLEKNPEFLSFASRKKIECRLLEKDSIIDESALITASLGGV